MKLIIRIVGVLLILMCSLLVWHFVSIKCHDVACAKFRDAWFKSKYDPNVPIFLTNKNGVEVLSNIKKPNERQLAEALLDKMVLAPFQTAYFQKSKPPISCAVVGKSGNLSGSNYGKLIDSHDFVFRVNHAPLKGFEVDVGYRTSFHFSLVIYGKTKFQSEYEASTVPVYYIANSHNGRNDHNEIISQKKHNNTYAEELRILAGIKDDLPGFEDNAQPQINFDLDKLPSGLLFMHPAFVEYVFRNWFNPPLEDPENYGYPSSGFDTVILALHLCDQVSVFGFGANSEGNWDYYFDLAGIDKPQPYHKADYQDSFLDDLNSRGIINLYRGNVKRTGIVKQVND